ncbi:MAG: hypothetical protein FMNOHCHN_03847 [Ignavibacteriaceae bacterium]|nr:hypothetical protein [Ignavibacteriaceae bacterium]
MVERGIPIEGISFQEVIAYATALSALAMAFRKEIRFEVRKRQQGRCDCCGEYAALQTHHRIPESLGGASSKIENAVGVCQTCHKELDREAFSGTIYPQVHTEAGYFPQGNGIIERHVRGRKKNERMG